MQYWLMKSEPNVWSIEQQKKMKEKNLTLKQVVNLKYGYDI